MEVRCLDPWGVGQRLRTIRGDVFPERDLVVRPMQVVPMLGDVLSALQEAASPARLRAVVPRRPPSRTERGLYPGLDARQASGLYCEVDLWGMLAGRSPEPLLLAIHLAGGLVLRSPDFMARNELLPVSVDLTRIWGRATLGPEQLVGIGADFITAEPSLERCALFASLMLGQLVDVQRLPAAFSRLDLPWNGDALAYTRIALAQHARGQRLVEALGAAP